MKITALGLIAGVLALLIYHSDSNTLTPPFATPATPFAPVAPLQPKMGSDVPDLWPVEKRMALDPALLVANPNGQLLHADGQVLHINFWAQWCAPCLRELPAFERLIHDILADGEKKYSVLLINLDSEESQGEAKKIQNELAPSAQAFYENTKIWTENLKPQALPYHILIDKKGRAAAAFYAPLDTKISDFKQRIQQLLNETD